MISEDPKKRGKNLPFSDFFFSSHRWGHHFSNILLITKKEDNIFWSSGGVQLVSFNFEQSLRRPGAVSRTHNALAKFGQFFQQNLPYPGAVSSTHDDMTKFYRFPGAKQKKQRFC